MTIDNFKDYEERVADSIKRMQDKRFKSLEKFIISKTYKVLSLKADPIIEQEIKILDKDYRNSRMLVIFKKLGLSYEVKMWVDPIKFEIVSEVKPQKQHVKWYSKGKFEQEEDWTSESKEDNYINLSYELEKFINFKIGKLTDSEIINTVSNVFRDCIKKRIEVLAKKSGTLFGNYNNEKIYNIEIFSFHTVIEGKIIFMAKEKDEVEHFDDVNFYKVDLVRCAENPEEYPIYTRKSKRLHTPEDPYGEEDWD